MRRLSLFIVFAIPVLLVGCQPSAQAPTASSSGTVEVEEALAPTEPDSEVASEMDTKGVVDAAESVDYGDWMAPPTAVSQRLQDMYKQQLEAVVGGDLSSAANLAMASQQVATELMQKNETAAGYAFYRQAGKAARQALEHGQPQLPGSFTGPIFYNEACALAKEGDVDQALSALSDAITHGFTDFELLSTDADMEAVRKIDGFEDRLAEWKAAALEKMKEHVREDLASGETFPFTLAATDIKGNAQALEDMQGKVVIVDVWGTWCPPCRAEIPSFIQLQEKYGEQGFQMVGLNYERKGDPEADLAAVVSYVEENGINYPCIMGDEEMRAQIPDFQGFPTTLFIDKSGKVRMKAVGLHEYAYLDAVVSELLAE